MTSDRLALARRARRLEYFTIAWNTLEGAIAVTAGALAGSIALVGFGVDSAIEVGSGAAVLWRMAGDADHATRERRERLALRTVGVCFLLLALYVTVESVGDLLRRDEPSPSVAGMALTCLSVLVMPLLARAKRRVAGAMGSGALHADARQTDFCAYLSAIVLAGLLLDAALGWWWADPIAALVMVPIIAAEGVRAVRGETCADCQ
jgi:divalent metal cation (Fe/Co/Zn/Cd) transporter